MSHKYLLINRLGHDIELTDVVNQKPCCGVVEFQKRRLRPDDQAEIEIKLAVGGRIDDISHQAEVITNPALPESLRLRTEADAIAEIRIEELDADDHLLFIGENVPRVANYQLIAAGTPGEPPVDLDKLEIRSSLTVNWIGPQIHSSDDRGLMINARQWVAPLATSEEIGHRTAEILFLLEGKPFYRHKIDWEMVRPIEPMPKMLAIQPGTSRYRITLRSRDARPFHIEGITCNLAMIEAQQPSSTDEVVQTVVFFEKPEIINDKVIGKITLTTSSPPLTT